ncbi:Holliday junction resolvase RuvX [Sporichthya polymorpha]|uniref:Holliday junction resolvase RuvX n=1 Tax=Sporichthya polymorpha TaxID=35751 RepID=UPI00036D135B|nr:Holliday junction resolvase RuvX [Sporichthya polymorpha]
MRSGVRLAVDLGSVRIGVAASDPSGLLAFPVETVRRGAGDVERLAALAVEHDVLEVLLGLPRGLSGREGEAARGVRAFAERLATVLPCPLRLVDERLSTVTAGSQMRAAGVNSRKGRSAIDQAAAVVFLQTALDAERATGDAPGEPVQCPDLG